MRIDGKNLKLDNTIIRCLVVGDTATGKSTFAASFPQPMKVFDFDKQPSAYAGIESTIDQYPENFSGWNEFMRDLAEFVAFQKKEGENHFKTVVIDSTTSLVNLAMQHALSVSPSKHPQGIPEGFVHFPIVKDYLATMLNRLRAIECHLVVLAHTEVDTETGTMVIQPALPGKLRVLFPRYFAELYHSAVKMVDNKPVRFLYTDSTALFPARSSLSGKKKLLPMQVENDFNVIMSHLKKGEI
jgi:hypothetical protein